MEQKSIFGIETCLVLNAVESIERKTTYPNYEIIIVADAKTPTEVIADLKRASPSHLKVVNYEKSLIFRINAI